MPTLDAFLRASISVLGALSLLALGGISTFAGDADAAKKKGKKPAAKPAAAAPAAPAAPAVTPVATKGADDLASFLVKPAEKAVADRRYGQAISLYRGIVAIRGDADPAVLALADVWTLAGEFEAAVEELERFAAATTDDERRTAAKQQIASLENRPRGFGGKVFTVEPAEKEAKDAFERGRKFFKAKKYAEAVKLFRAGVEMAPGVVGNYRELGAAYDKLGKQDEASAFFARYLRLQPFGKNADEVRKRLVKSKMTGTLSVDSSFPCDQVWINRQPVPQKLPIKSMTVAPGRYRLLCYAEKFHFARYVDVSVPKGGTAKAAFSWAVVVNELDPWGRVVLENPDRPSEMNDVGIWKEIGVPVPDDRRALKVVLRSGDRSKSKELLLKLEPGKRVSLKW